MTPTDKASSQQVVSTRPLLSDQRGRLLPAYVRRMCWHRWVCRMGHTGCSCARSHCSLCGLSWEDR